MLASPVGLLSILFLCGIVSLLSLTGPSRSCVHLASGVSVFCHRQFVAAQVVHTVDLVIDVTSMQPCVIFGGDVLPAVVGRGSRVRHRVSVAHD
jgi:hypothetical protein